MIISISQSFDFMSDGPGMGGDTTSSQTLAYAAGLPRVSGGLWPFSGAALTYRPWPSGPVELTPGR